MSNSKVFYCFIAVCLVAILVGMVVAINLRANARLKAKEDAERQLVEDCLANPPKPSNYDILVKQRHQHDFDNRVREKALLDDIEKNLQELRAMNQLPAEQPEVK